jgi:hypothetical protein
MSQLNDWRKLVAETHKNLKEKNPDATLGDAMKVASKKRKSLRKRGGSTATMAPKGGNAHTMAPKGGSAVPTVKVAGGFDPNPEVINGYSPSSIDLPHTNTPSATSLSVAVKGGKKNKSKRSKTEKRKTNKRKTEKRRRN